MHTFEVRFYTIKPSPLTDLDISLVTHYNKFNLYSHKFNIAKIFFDVDIYWLTVYLTCMKIPLFNNS